MDKNLKHRKTIPVEGTLETPVCKESFMLLAKGITRHLDIECIISLQGTDVKIRVRITHIIAPEQSQVNIEAVGSESNFLDKSGVDGMHRASNKIQEKLLGGSWQLFGKTLDTAERPICIVIIPGVMTGYAFKRDGEDIKKFNPSLN